MDRDDDPLAQRDREHRVGREDRPDVEDEHGRAGGLGDLLPIEEDGNGDDADVAPEPEPIEPQPVHPEHAAFVLLGVALTLVVILTAL